LSEEADHAPAVHEGRPSQSTLPASTIQLAQVAGVSLYLSTTPKHKGKMCKRTPSLFANDIVVVLRIDS
jgi:hypothetical protein